MNPTAVNAATSALILSRSQKSFDVADAEAAGCYSAAASHIMIVLLLSDTAISTFR